MDAALAEVGSADPREQFRVIGRTVRSWARTHPAVSYTHLDVYKRQEELRDGRGREAAVAALARTLPTAGRTVLILSLIHI